MTPTDPRLLVHAYVDGELDPAHALEVERQLADDPALAVERERVEALRRVIAEQLPREGAPPGLARRIEAAVGLRPAPASRARLGTPVLARARGLSRGGRVPRQRRDLVGAVARPGRCRHGRGQPRARADGDASR
jgi:anti-sigma factor RsiW